MDEFLFIKLNRAIWISLLEQSKIMEAMNYYGNYTKSLKSFLQKVTEEKNDSLKELVECEIKSSKNIYTNKLARMAKLFYQRKDYSNALICYTVVFMNGREVDMREFANSLTQLQQYDLKEDVMAYLESTTNNKKVYKIFSEIFEEEKNYKKAIEYLEKYISLPEYKKDAYDYNLLGCYYHKYAASKDNELSLLSKAVDCFIEAYNISPSRFFAKNVVIVSGSARRFDVSKKYWDIIINSNEMTYDDKYDYAAFCLKHEDFDGWHKYFDARFKKENNATPFPKINKPVWDGKTDLSDSTLLIHSEQGFGDTFLMFGYLPRVKKLAKKIILVVQSAAYELLKQNITDIEILPDNNVNLDNLDFDYYLPMMSIPIALKFKRKDVPTGKAYINARSELVKEYKQKYFDNKNFKIGISFSGNSAGNKTRDINVAEFLPLDKLKGIELYCINKNIEDSFFAGFKNNKVNNLSKVFNNFDDTAAAIENLDLVLTSDNGLLNLAGAMGKRTFALFNFDNEFRWFDLSGENVIWYDSVKPFVNDKQNNWQYSINNAISEIKKLVKQKNK